MQCCTLLQDTGPTQDSGHRTTGPGPDLNKLMFQGEIPSAAYCRHYQITLDLKFSPSPRAQVYN